MKNKWIALLRGINVGGKNLLPMSGLIAELKALELENIRTYIQSGNVVFDSLTKIASMSCQTRSPSGLKASSALVPKS